MTTTSPPPPTRGTKRYLLLALLLLLLGGGILWSVMGGDEAEAPVAEGPEDGGAPPPTQQLGGTDLLLPDDIPDGGPEEPVAAPDEGQQRRPRSASSSWDCRGDLDRAAAARVISQHRPQVRACYERALKQNNVLEGKLNVDLRIGASGRVDAVRFGGSLRDQDVRSCVRRLTRSWQFPSPGGARCAVVSVPFNLTPRP